MFSSNMSTKSLLICLHLLTLSFPEPERMLALRKPNILIPLSAAASRGDQILNANSFRTSGYSYVLEEEEVTNTTLLEAIDYVFAHREAYVDAMKKNTEKDSIELIVDLIKDASR